MSDGQALPFRAALEHYFPDQIEEFDAAKAELESIHPSQRGEPGIAALFNSRGGSSTFQQCERRTADAWLVVTAAFRALLMHGVVVAIGESRGSSVRSVLSTKDWREWQLQPAPEGIFGEDNGEGRSPLFVNVAYVDAMANGVRGSGDAH